MVVHQQTLEVLERQKKLVENNTHELRLKDPKKHADEILKKAVHTARLEHAIMTETLNSAARNAIRREIKAIRNRIRGTEGFISTTGRYGPSPHANITEMATRRNLSTDEIRKNKKLVIRLRNELNSWKFDQK